MQTVLKIDARDNVVTCLRKVSKGDSISLGPERVVSQSDIPAFHKMAVKTIKYGDMCYKYGEVIGKATKDILPGEHVHTHNIISLRD